VFALSPVGCSDQLCLLWEHQAAFGFCAVEVPARGQWDLLGGRGQQFGQLSALSLSATVAGAPNGGAFLSVQPAKRLCCSYCKHASVWVISPPLSTTGVTLEWHWSLLGLLVGCGRAGVTLEGPMGLVFKGTPGQDTMVSQVGGECSCWLLQVSGSLGWGRGREMVPTALLFLEKHPEDPCPSSTCSEVSN